MYAPKGMLKGETSEQYLERLEARNPSRLLSKLRIERVISDTIPMGDIQIPRGVDVTKNGDLANLVGSRLDNLLRFTEEEICAEKKPIRNIPPQIVLDYIAEHFPYQ
jgi:hypothetical protein